MKRRHHQDLCCRGMNPNEACALALRAAAGQGGFRCCSPVDCFSLHDAACTACGSWCGTWCGSCNFHISSASFISPFFSQSSCLQRWRISLDELRAAETTRDYSGVCTQVSSSCQTAGGSGTRQRWMSNYWCSLSTTVTSVNHCHNALCQACATESSNSLCMGMLAHAADSLLFFQP